MGTCIHRCIPCNLRMEILRIPVMPFAIGLYLPIYLNATIMIGGVVRMITGWQKER